MPHVMSVSMSGVFNMAPVADQKLTGLVAATFTPLTPQGLVIDLFFQPLSVLVLSFCPAQKDVFWQLKIQKMIVNILYVDHHTPVMMGWCSFCQMCWPIFFTFSPNSEINLSEIGPYIDYLTEKQGVNNIFGKFSSGFFL